MSISNISPKISISEIISSKMDRRYRQQILKIISGIGASLSLIYAVIFWFAYENFYSSLTDCIYALLYLCNFYWIKQGKYILSAYWLIFWTGAQVATGTIFFVSPETGFQLYFLTQPVIVYLFLSKQPLWAQAGTILYGFILFIASQTIQVENYLAPIPELVATWIFIVNAFIVFTIIFITIKFFSDGIERAYQDQKKLVLTDSLTGLANDRYVQQHASRLISQCDRYGHALSLIILDIDNFQAFNTRYGQKAGDLILKNIANLLIDDVRDADLAARIGGNEFVIILPETLVDEACLIAERLRKGIEDSHVMFRKNALSFTASFGVSCHHSNPTPNLNEVINSANSALNEAKTQGRNQVRQKYAG